MSLLNHSYVCRACARSQRALLSRSFLSTNKNVQSRTYAAINGGERPFRMAVIGSGPAGFYTAYKVMARIPHAKVDMYEQLPIPYGLVRFGVAPDHPEVKNCEDKFEEVATSPNFNFIGNTTIGQGPNSLPLTSLVPHYDAILFAYGASKDKSLGIEGEHLKGVHSARAFVGWYNGLPEYAHLAPDLTAGEDAVVIGQGNVALDVARILLSPVDHLRHTDITEHALDILSKSRVKNVRVIGRRGPLQAAFTIKELRELLRIPSVSYTPMESELIPPSTVKLERASKRIMDLLVKGSESSPASKNWSLDFRLSPIRFNSSPDTPDQLAGVTLERTELSPDIFDKSARAIGTGELVDFPASIGFRSIGYKSEALSGLLDIGIPFDDKRGIIPNDFLGRVLSPGGPEHSPMHVPGMYCAGWVKRGPTGVIASTMSDAFTTAETIAHDWQANAPFISHDDSTHLGWDGVKADAEQRGCRPVSWADWGKIDQAEKAKGKELGKIREKFTNVDDMLAVLD